MVKLLMEDDMTYKNNFLIILNQKSVIFLYVLCLFSFFSCSKDISETTSGSQEIGIGLTVNVGGIREEFQTIASTVTNHNVKENLASDILYYDDFDALASVEDYSHRYLSNSAKITSRGKDRIAANSPVQQGVQYYLVLFEDNNGSRGAYMRSDLLTAGQAFTIKVEEGKKYHWIAYSYNSIENDLPQINFMSESTVSMGVNKDFLYASGISGVVSSTNPTFLSIVFDHMLSRVGVEVNTRGMFADINELNIELVNTNLKVANFNLLNQEITASTVEYGENLQLSAMGGVPSSPRADTKVAFVYIPPYSGSLNNFQVRLRKLTINLDAQAQALGHSTRTFEYTSTNGPVFTSNLGNLLKGKAKVVKIDLLESPLTISSRGYYYLIVLPVGYFDHNVKWARSNLYHNRLDNSYRFQHINIPSFNRESYFSWGSANPLAYGTNSDPCSLVYPAGVWKMPSATDFYATIGGTVTDINLLNLIKVNLNLLGINLAGIYFPTPSSRNRTATYTEYTPDSGQSTFYNATTDVGINNKIRFNYNGFYANIGLVENLINLNLGEAGNISRIWTSTANVSLLGLAGVGAVSYSGTALTDYLDASLLNLLNINALGIDVAKTDLNNIRCVRSN
ncbi:fimbrillin family protein [Sphingobacterium bovistauri]|uniref:Fimbrillin-like n=1 Tax=Sphingobacterium bovistauri TaxID=2781959 RepID=A0ABS7Z983_9SPHI|nr:fimbrillin family protein [Sphingobacterium bovistauri]MCA5005514.1 hypothetical protein [Sphingobacterium bovistauri]